MRAANEAFQRGEIDYETYKARVAGILQRYGATSGGGAPETLEGGTDVFKDAGAALSSAWEEFTGEAAERRRNQRADEIVGQLRGELAGIGDAESALSEAYADPRDVEAQRLALQQLQQIGTEGYTAGDRARQQMMMQQERTAERGQREAIQQQMQARGLGGSGTALQAQLVGQQGAANRANMRGLGLEEMAQRRALQAIQAAGQMGGDMRKQGFGEEATRRGGRDAVQQYNINNRRSDAKDAVALRLGQYSQNAQRQQAQQGAAIAGAAGVANAVTGGAFDLLDSDDDDDD